MKSIIIAQRIAIGLGYLVLIYMAALLSSCQSPSERKEEGFEQLKDQVEAQAMQNMEDSEVRARNNSKLDIVKTETHTLVIDSSNYEADGYHRVYEVINDCREYQLEVNSDGSIDLFDGTRLVKHFEHIDKGDRLSTTIMEDNL